MARALETSTPEELIEGNVDRLEAEGTFHFLILLMKDQEMAYTDDRVDGYSAQLQVLEGEHAGKSLGITLYDGNASHKDSGAFARKKQTAFFIAANLLTPQQMGQSITIDETQGAGAQVIAKIKYGKENDKTGKRYLDIDGL